MVHVESNSLLQNMVHVESNESSTREEKSVPSHYTGKVREHESVLACLTLYSPPCLCAKHVQTTSKLTESARRVHLTLAFFAMRICTYAYQFHICIIQHTHAHCASSDKPHPFMYDIILLTSPMGSSS